jgi:hypothetical protein
LRRASISVGDGPCQSRRAIQPDAKTDVAVANQLSDNISVLLVTGWHLAAPVNFAAGDDLVRSRRVISTATAKRILPTAFPTTSRCFERRRHFAVPANFSRGDFPSVTTGD